jgi:hypothetical protein
MYVTKISLIMFDNLHVTIVTNDMVFGWKIQVNKMLFHLLTKHIHIVV